jgi:hypothetical protein
MNHKSTMLLVTVIVGAMMMTGIAAMVTPQLALAGGHHYHNNGVEVSQTTDQADYFLFEAILSSRETVMI